MATSKRDWYGRMLESSLTLKLQTADALLQHATPAVLVDALPSEEVAAVLSGALKSGTMSAAHIVDTVTVATLSEFLPEEVLWASLSAVAGTSGLDKTAPATDAARDFLAGALQAGLETGQISAEGILDHANPSVLTENLPAANSAALLQASLAAGSMSPQLVVDTIPPATLAEHLPANVLWAAVCSAAGAAVPKADKKEAKAAKAAETPKQSAAELAAADGEETEVRPEEGESKRSTGPTPGRVLSGNTGIGKPTLGGNRIRSPRR